MILTSKQIIEEKLITKIDNPKCIQQVGIDLEVIKICKVNGIGMILKNQTILPGYEEMDPTSGDSMKTLLGEADSEGWMLDPGYYEVTLKQGCKLPNNRTLKLKQRSSLNRSGGVVQAGLYDPGFQTENIGAFLTIYRPIFIEKGARICQAYILKSAKTNNSYKGQFQKDKQRKENV